MDIDRFRALYDMFISGIPTNVYTAGSQMFSVSLPFLSQTDLIEICNAATKIFADEPSLIYLDAPINVVGDIHGHILDFFYIISRFGQPPSQKYLFLGDLVDRGEFSLECVTLVFLMKILWPKHVYLIRGNHEFFQQCSQGGFDEQMRKIYCDPSVINRYVNVFDYLPFGAVISKKFVCVHGGIGPGVAKLEDIASIKRPIHDFGNDVVDSLCWSDPADCEDFAESNRGIGFLYGKKVVEEFHRTNGTTFLIRGHECVLEGMQENYGGSVITVFSASNYCGLIENMGAIMAIMDDTSYEARKWGPLPYLLRTRVTFSYPNGVSSLRKIVKKTQSTKNLPIYSGVNINDNSSVIDGAGTMGNKPTKVYASAYDMLQGNGRDNNINSDAKNDEHYDTLPGTRTQLVKFADKTGNFVQIKARQTQVMAPGQVSLPSIKKKLVKRNSSIFGSKCFHIDYQ